MTTLPKAIQRFGVVQIKISGYVILYKYIYVYVYIYMTYMYVYTYMSVLCYILCIYDICMSYVIYNI